MQRQTHIEKRRCGDTGRVPLTRQGMSEATRSKERGLEQILLHSPRKESTLIRFNQNQHLAFGFLAFTTVR